MATQRSAARGKSAKGAARPAAGRGSAKTSTPPPKRPAPSETSGKKAPAGKAVPPRAAPSGKPTKSGPTRTGVGKPAPGKSTAGKGAAPASAAASKKGATGGKSASGGAASGGAAGGRPTAGKQPVATPAASSTRPRTSPPARSEPVSKAGGSGKSAPPSKSPPAKAAPPSRAGGPTKAAPPPKASQLTKPAPVKGPAPPRATVGGRPLHARPKLPKSDLGGDETIVLVPARTSDTAGPKGAAAAPARSGGRSGSERATVSSASRAAATVVTPVLPLPIRKRDEPMSLEERAEAIERRLAAQSEEFRQRYWDTFYMSWIYHDSALEGVVYTVDELRAALGSPTTGATGSGSGGGASATATAAAGSASTPPPPPSSGSIPPAPSSSPGDDGALETNIQPACEEIRRHREAIDYIRDYAKKKGPITVDVIRKIFLILHPEEGDLKSVKYRRDIPQHRLYFHEYEQPDKIAHKVRGVVDWLNDPETKKGRNGLRISARAHYDLLRVFPFQSDSGKVSRLFMNLLLLRSGLPPSIILSAERQRYYDALKGSANQILTMVQESVEVALQSIERLLDEHDAKSRPPSPP